MGPFRSASMIGASAWRDALYHVCLAERARQNTIRDGVDMKQRWVSTESREDATSVVGRSAGGTPVKSLISEFPGDPGVLAMLAERVALLLWVWRRAKPP